MDVKKHIRDKKTLQQNVEKQRLPSAQIPPNLICQYHLKISHYLVQSFVIGYFINRSKIDNGRGKM